MANVHPLTNGDPRRLGAYEVTGRLGEGGQGVVYLGRGAAEHVAIKVLHAQLIENQAARARFVREVEVTTRVARFCTAQVLHAGMADDRPYIVSEYVPGPSLQEQVRREGPRQGAALDRLAINTATALAAIHQAGVVHRDFKPGNVLMGPDGPVVIDFGIARALDASGPMTTAASQVVGTPAFMAPEQLAEGQVGPATDLFAWGITMVFAATGVPAFGNQSIPKVIHRILNDEPDLGALDGRLRDVVAASLAKDPARRPAARQLMDALMGNGGVVLASSPGPAGDPAPGPRGPAVSGAPGHGSQAATESLPASGRPGGATEILPPAGPPGGATKVLPGRAAQRPPAGPPGPPTRRLPPQYQPAASPAGARPTAGPGPRPPSGPPPSAFGTEPSSRGRGTGGVVAALVAVAVLVLGIGVVWAATRSDDEPKAAASPTRSAKRHRTTARHRTPPPGQVTRGSTASRPPATKKPVRANPYTAERLCGDGFRVIDRHGLGAATAYLLYNVDTGVNCVVTMVARSTGRTYLGASLQVKDGARADRSGMYPFNAGPVRLPAKGRCVQWGGVSKTARWMSGWSHCGA